MRAELKRRDVLEATDDYLAELAADVGEPTERQQARDDAIVRRIRDRQLHHTGYHVLIIDSGGVSRLGERSTRTLALIRALRDDGLWPPIAPTVALVESLQGRSPAPGSSTATRSAITTSSQQLQSRCCAATSCSINRNYCRSEARTRRIVWALAQLAVRLGNAGHTVSISVVGGAVIVLEHNPDRGATNDIDCCINATPATRTAVDSVIADISRQRGWPNEWMRAANHLDSVIACTPD